MDRISGFLPPVGWSPLLMTSLPKVAPATTVEAMVGASSSNSGQGANVNTQSGQSGSDKAQALAKLAPEKMLDTASDGEREAQVRDSEILALPAGPSPAFRVSLLEQQAARVRVNSAIVEAPPEEAVAPKEVYSSLTHDLFKTETGWSAVTGDVGTPDAPDIDNSSAETSKVPAGEPEASALLDVTR